MFCRLFSIVALSGFCFLVTAQNPCDDVYGAYCPEEAGFSVGECLKKLTEPSAISEKCAEFINVHDQCKVEIESHCAGMVI